MARGVPGEEIYTPQVQPEDLPRKVIPRAPDLSLAPALSDLAGGFEAIAKKQEAKARADSATWAGDELADFRLKAAKNLEDLKANTPAGDPGDFTGNYLKQFDQDAQPLAANAAKNEYSRAIVHNGLRELRTSYAMEAMNFEATQRIDYQNQSISDNLDKQLPLVRANPSLAPQVGRTLSDQINSSNNSPGLKLKDIRAMDQQLSTNAALGLADRDPDSVYTQLKPGGVAKDELLTRLINPQDRAAVLEAASKGVAVLQAHGVVQAYAMHGPQAGAAAEAAIDKLPYEQPIKDQIHAEAQRALGLYRDTQRDKYGNQIIGLETRIATGQPDAGDRGVLMDLYHRNVFDPAQAGNKMGQLENAYDKQAATRAVATATSNAYQNGLPLDPKDKDTREGIDALFVQNVGKQPAGSAQWINFGADIASRTGVVPPSMVTWARTQLVSGAPQPAAQAAEALERLQLASPRGAPYSIDDKTKAMAAVINEDIRAGRDPTAAVEGARQVAQLDPKYVSALDARLRSLKPANFVASDVNGFFDKVPGAKVGGAFGLGGELPPLPGNHAILTDYNDLLAHYYRETGGNLAAAKAAAGADLVRVWGVSGVNGKREFMRWAPEAAMDPQHLVPQEKTTAFIRKDLEDSAQKEFPGLDRKGLAIVADSTTDRSNGRRFSVYETDALGHRTPLLRGNGEPVTWTVPDGQKLYETERARLIEESRKGAQEARDAWEVKRKADPT